MAPGRRTSKPVQKTSSRNDGQNRSSVQDDTPRALSREDVTCKICLEILFKPVTLPCKHTMCYSCFENCVEKSNLTCPLCRKRIAVWARQSRKANTVVDEKLWADIRSQYPDLIKAFMEGKTADLDSEDVLPTVAMHQFAEPGDLRKEYEAEQERICKAEEERRRREELASAELLAQIEREQAEELARTEELERQRLRDEALAKELAEQESIPVTVTLKNSTVIETPQSCRKRKSTVDMSKSTPAAKKINSFFSSRFHSVDSDELSSSSPSAFAAVTEHLPKSVPVNWEQRETSSELSVEAVDHLNRLHFRPINAAPLTPPKNSPGNATLVKPQVIDGTARNLTRFYDADFSGDLNHNHDEPTTSGMLAEELKELERQWLKKKQEQEEADRAYALKLQEELNKEEVSRTPPVNRAKGSKDEYNFRSKRNSSVRQKKIEETFQKPSRKSAP